MARVSALEIAIRRKSYPGGNGSPPRRVLRDLELTVDEGAFVCILGPSGCGKTTLLNLIAGLDSDFEGQIERASAHGGKPRIGYVFQEPVLLPWRTVGENLRLVMQPAQIAAGADRSLLKAMGLDDYRDGYPKSLSLGMSRRVALARAFAVEPDLLLMDEPFVSIDESAARDLRRLLVRTWRAKPTTVIFVTHDSRDAVELGERVIVLAGSPAQVALDRRIDLTDAERADPGAVEAKHREILEEVVASEESASWPIPTAIT